MSNPSLILPQSPAYGEDYVYAAQVYDGEVPVYDVLPLTFTRASGGSRINKDGLVQNMPYNLFEYSQSLTNGVWVGVSASYSGDTLTASSGTGFKGLYQNQTTQGQQTVFFDVLYTNHQWVQIGLGTGASDLGYVNFDLQNKVVGTQGGGFVGSIQDFGTYIRIAVTFSSVDKTSVFLCFVNSGTASRADSTSSTGNIKLYKAQLNIGSTAQPYLATTDRLNMPRITYPVGGGCGALLLEKQSTNYAIYSEDLTQYNSNISGGTVGANATTSPDGTQNADSFTVNTASSAHSGFYESPNGTNGSPFTASIFLKAGTGRYFLFRAMTNSYSTRYGVTIDLQTGTILSSNTQGSPTGTSSKIENFGNGWYRVMLTMNTIGTQIAGVWGTSNTATPSLDAYLDYSYTGNGTDSYYIWGMTLENSAYATSYISTTSASSTRIADVCLTTSVPNLIGQTEGTLFVEMVRTNTLETFFVMLSNIMGTTANAYQNSVYLFQLSNGNFICDIWAGNVPQVTSSTTYLSVGTHKLAVAYKQNDFVVYVDGVQRVVDTSGNVPALNYLTLAGAVDGGAVQNIINETILYKTRLTNSELATLTTL